MQCKADLFQCKRMTDATLNACKSALGNLIASEQIQQAPNPSKAFTSGLNFFLAHYCHDVHTSSWCHHLSVKNELYQYTCIFIQISRIQTEVHIDLSTILPVSHRWLGF